MTSQWAAVGAETDLLRRARQLQKSWERLLADGALGPEMPPGATTGVRPRIVESWRRSLATGLDPTDLLAPIEADESEVFRRWLEHPLGSLSHVITEHLRNVADESRSLVVVTDASGFVMHRVGDEPLKERAAADMNLVEGASYSEAADGTNGIGTALAADHAFQVFAFEHFNERHREWVCSGAPVHDPVSGNIVGLIDLSSPWKAAHPGSLELVTTVARAIEQCLVDARRDRDARLRRRYTDFMTRSTDLLVDREGYLLDGARPKQHTPLEIPDGGGEVVLGDGSVAEADPLGRGEAFLLRQGATRHGKPAAPVSGLERAEERARELATEQAALRQVATLVARESSPDQLFAVVAEQVARILEVPHVRLVRYEPDGSLVVGGFSDGEAEPFPIGSRWLLDDPGVTTTVRRTGRPARVEDYAQVTGEIGAVARSVGMRSAVASPIVVQRRLWGAIVALSPRQAPLPAHTEARLADFTELVATAIANAEAREALARLADEQTALRRVATLVAGGTSADELFAAVADEVQQLLGAEGSAVVRFEDDGTVVTVGTHGGPFAAGTRSELDPHFVVGAVRRTRRAARFDTDDPATADIPAIARDWGIRSIVASPIIVEGDMWGAMVVASQHSLPHDSEARLGDFTDLVATAVANTQARQEVVALADEQAALRRVATLVAHDAAPAEIFAAVSAEVDRIFGLDPAAFDVAAVGRFDPGPELVVVGLSKDLEVVPLGSRWPFDELFAPTHVLRTRRSARIRADDLESDGGEVAEFLRQHGYLSQVASPIVVDGRLWGTMSVNSRDDLPPDTEERLERFTDLVATAIANAESREARAMLTEEQAALRRVATLVAQGASPQNLFEAVAEEVGRLLPVGSATMGRFEPDGSVATMASWCTTDAAFPAGMRWPTEGTNVAWMVLQTGQPARRDDYSAATDPVGVMTREAGINSVVGSPIVVDGHLWGVMTAASSELIPPGAEARLASFTELVATAIANAESSAELAASRRRIVAASDDARRRIERDLHDGVQQQLVSLGLELGSMTADPPTGDALTERLASVTEDVGAVLDALVEAARGIHPAILSQGGLAPALKALARRSAVPVELHAEIDGPLPDAVEVAAYYVAAEALTNAAKHARATVVHLDATTEDRTLTMRVRDDGVGGADPVAGSGLVGLQDRVEALGGAIRIDSPAGRGTGVVVTLPIATEPAQETVNLLGPPQAPGSSSTIPGQASPKQS